MKGVVWCVLKRLVWCGVVCNVVKGVVRSGAVCGEGGGVVSGICSAVQCLLTCGELIIAP